jgi:hypothetical protein
MPEAPAETPATSQSVPSQPGSGPARKGAFPVFAVVAGAGVLAVAAGVGIWMLKSGSSKAGASPVAIASPGVTPTPVVATVSVAANPQTTLVTMATPVAKLTTARPTMAPGPRPTQP